MENWQIWYLPTQRPQRPSTRLIWAYPLALSTIRDSVMGRIIVSKETDPYLNLALEEELLFTPHEGTWLYLWQNQNTVVIGRNQNPYMECDPGYMSRKKMKLARRLSGGGAVYHDLGNLNYTFLCREEEMDAKSQTRLISQALLSLGIQCCFSGRNDLLYDGRKFSGQAYYSEDGFSYHHGTIMIDLDMEVMEKALTPSRLKLDAKGISSVRSRVVNLKSICPAITAEAVADSLIKYYEESFGPAAVEIWDFKERLPSSSAKYRDPEWNLGKCPSYEASMDIAAAKGIFRLKVRVENGLIAEAALSSDSLEGLELHKLEQGLIGCLFEEEQVRRHLNS